MTRRSTVLPRFGLVLVMILILASLGGGAGAAVDHFTDDNGNVHEANINYIADLGITYGCNLDGTLFCPDDDVTRAEMASFIARALALPSALADYFTDDNTNIHQANINRIAQAGITQGCSADGTKYCPDAYITRAEMASLIVRAIELVPWSADYFVDVPTTLPFHAANINALAGHGITVGCTADSFCPGANVRRDEMASFLARMLQLGSDRAPTVTITSPANLATFLTAWDGAEFSKEITFDSTVVGATAITWRSSAPVAAWLSGAGVSLGSGSGPTATLAIPSGQTSSQPTIQEYAEDAVGLFAMDQIQIKLILPSP